jgi:enoyl-CoA hydratase/carnithine racemase
VNLRQAHAPDTISSSKRPRGSLKKEEIAMDLETLRIRKEGAVLFADIAAPPMNLLGPPLVRDLVSLIRQAEGDDTIKVLVFRSADPDYFISHVDVTRIGEYREATAKLTGEASLGLLFRYLSASRLVTVAQIEGRVRGAGSEFGLIPGAGGIQHLARLMGRSRALEAILTADDYNADLAEHYGWINRALAASELGDFVNLLAHRISKFPAAVLVAVKERVNEIALAPAEDFRRDSDLFLERSRSPEAQHRIKDAVPRGFQTRDGERELGRMLDDLADR